MSNKYSLLLYSIVCTLHHSIFIICSCMTASYKQSACHVDRRYTTRSTLTIFVQNMFTVWIPLLCRVILIKSETWFFTHGLRRRSLTQNFISKGRPFILLHFISAFAIRTFLKFSINTVDWFRWNPCGNLMAVMSWLNNYIWYICADLISLRYTNASAAYN